MESRHCGQDKRIFFCPVHNPSIPCSLQAFGIRCMAAMLVYTTKECNYNFIVIVHQHGGYDVTCKPKILQDRLQYRGIVKRIGQDTGTEENGSSDLTFREVREDNKFWQPAKLSSEC